mgnify:CR=1 FL=1
MPRIIAELTAPMVVDGKTPGQVNQAAFAYSVENHHESKGVPNWEIAANAVLRAFGNGAKTKEALQKVRERIEKARIDSFAAKQETPVQFAANAAYRCSMEFIDTEIANIEGVKA